MGNAQPPAARRRFGMLSKKLIMAMASVAMFMPFVVSEGGTAYAKVTDPVEVTVKGADVAKAAKNQNGLTFKGFGVLSGNSTSSLLMDYKAQNPEAYWKMIEVLFGGTNPIMNTVKVEMGNDRNTSTGPDPAVMRTADEYPDVAREPGFQLAADALKVNPNVKVSILRWKYPKWVGSDSNYDNIYKWYKNTILAVYRQYGYMIDSVNPHINESSPNLSWTKDFKNRVQTDEVGFIGAGTTKDLDGNDVPAWSSDTEKKLFHKIRVIISDEVGTGSFGDDMLKDKSLRDAVDIAGYHYNTADQGNNFKTLADDYDKEIWNSEAQASFSVMADRPNNTMSLNAGEGNGTNNGKNNGTSGTGIGGISSALEMANTYVKGFNSSRRTNFVYQPAISAFYDGFQYSSKELITMHDPWSGVINWDGALAVLEQVSRFAKTGYETNDADKDANGIWRGIPSASRSDITDGNPPGRGTGDGSSRGGASSYMTLAAPDASDFSTVIVNDSQYTKTYRIKAEDMNLGSDTTMELWETRAADQGQAYNANYVKPFAELKPGADGYYEFQVKPWSIVTATTLDDAKASSDGKSFTARDNKGSQMPSNKEYVDGNDYAVLDTDDSGDKNGDTNNSLIYADDFEYTGKTVTSYDPKTGKDVTEDYLKSRGGDTGATPRYTNDTNGAFEVVRQSDGNHVIRQQVGAGMDAGAWNGGDPRTTIGDYRWANYQVSADVLFETNQGYATVGARQWGNSGNGLDNSVAQLKVTPSGAWTFMRYSSTVASGKAPSSFKTGANQWNTLAVKVLGNVYTAYINGEEVATYTDANPQATGRIQLGSSFDFVQFDNLKIAKIDGATPYYTDLIDNMHQRSWKNNAVALLAYNGEWQHLDGQGMYVYKRSISNSTGKGATLTYTFNGTGIDLNGANSGKAKLNVTVDGKQVALNATTTKSSATQPTTYELRGLKNGKHTVTFETATDDGISIDNVGIVKATGVNSAAADTVALKAAYALAKDAVEGDYQPATWGVFSTVRDEAAAALDNPASYGLDTEGANAIAARLTAAQKNLVGKDVSPELKPLGLTAAVAKDDKLPSSLTIDGKSVGVSWNEEAAEIIAKASDYSKVTISGITTEKLDDNYKYRFTTQVEVLPSRNIEYFIDSGAGRTSPEYAAVKEAVNGLKNAQADQRAGEWGYSSNASVKGNTDTTDKFNTGLYVTAGDGNQSTLEYKLPLEAGSYDLTAGFTEWWGSQNRSMKLQATWVENGETKTADGSELAALTATGQTSTGTVAFTLASDATVTFKVSKTGKSAPVISWLAVEKQPVALGVIASVQGSGLPGTVSYRGAEVPVSWTTDAVTAVAKASAYDTVAVTGQAAIGGKKQAITANVEIVPSGLTYYIDSGTDGKDSPQYTAVKSVVKDLKNDKVDQISDGTVWGYDASGAKVKGGADLTDKYSTGLYQNTTRQIYYLPLEAGKYTLTGGFAEWWNQERSMYATVNANAVELAKGTVPLSGSNNRATSTLTFTLEQDAIVKYVVTNEGAGGNKPVISWLAVSKESASKPEPADKAALAAAIANAGQLRETDYTASSWTKFAETLATANATQANESATQTDVDNATMALTAAQQALVKRVLVNVDALVTAIANAEKLNQSDYADGLWNQFVQAFDAAKGILARAKAQNDGGDPTLDQTAITAAVQALAEAQGKLKPNKPVSKPADKTTLSEAIAKAEALEAKDYTQQSYAKLAEALAAAKTVLDRTDATQSEVDAAVQLVDDAIAALARVPGSAARQPSSSIGDNVEEQDKLSDTGSSVIAVAVLAVLCVMVGAVLIVAKCRRA